MIEQINRSYYAVIPANVRYDKNIPANAKLLYGEITALANDKGYCWASNSYFAELYEVSKETISRWISKLEKSGYVNVQIIYKNNTKEIIERRIYINGIPQIVSEKTFVQSDDKINTSNQNNQDAIDQNINTPIDENVKDNNTVFNNTINNNLYISKEIYVISDDEVINLWNSLNINNIVSISGTRKKMLNARLKEYKKNNFIKAIENIRQSSFLKGQNQKGWVITFDWFIKPNNFVKVLENNYADKQQEKKTTNAATDKPVPKFNVKMKDWEPEHLTQEQLDELGII